MKPRILVTYEDERETCDVCDTLPANKESKVSCSLVKRCVLKSHGKFLKSKDRFATIFDGQVQDELANELERRIKERV